MVKETRALAANFELLLTSIRKSSVHTEGVATAKPSQQARSNAGSEFKSAAASKVPRLSDLCEECEHAIRLHGKYGCEYERGDNLAGSAALPPCGCQAWEVEEDSLKAHLEARDNYLDHISGCDE